MGKIDEGAMLAIAIGNTVTKLGLFRGEELKATWGVMTPESMTPSEAQTVLMNFDAAIDDADVPYPTGSIIASVVPTLTDTWVGVLSRWCGARPLVVGPGLKTGMRLGYSDPSEIGADRIADAAAARSMFPLPLIAITMGATTTFNVINEKGDFIGGVIAPGLDASMRSLSMTAAKIPVVDLRAPKAIIARSTREAVQAGAVMGEVARIDGLIEMIESELGASAHVVAAGAHARLLQALSTHIDECVDDLTLRGLRVLYERNRK